ncbi:MAG: class I SAM-dependent RNA methyltransferase [Roseivivax sp.]|nr:class I SAM-dependent RNA methyltransferase [Roseivivax sp.]
MDSYTIERLGHHGDGIADGPVYAPGALPGEVVTGTLDGAVLRDLRIVTPSADRVRPPCPHARSCGGCQVQHASDGFVAEWKRAVVRTALAAHGLTPDIALPVASPPRSRRRATLSGRRTKKGALIGFHAKGSDVIVPIPECHLLTPALMAALPFVETLVARTGSRKGEVSVQIAASDTGIDLDLRGAKPLDAEAQQELAQLASQHGIARIAIEGEPALTLHPPVYRFDGIAVTPPPGAFLQATAEGEAALRSAVTGIVGNAARIVDLFAGCGTFALPLARQAQVHAVEGDAAMVHALQAGWRQAGGLHALTAEARDLFRNPVIAADLAGFEAAVIDPPRAGAEAQVVELARARVPRIAHVSCNPVTFARDCATLERAGYTMGPVTVVDQFRWSTHVEVVCGLTLS